MLVRGLVGAGGSTRARACARGVALPSGGGGGAPSVSTLVTESSNLTMRSPPAISSKKAAALAVSSQGSATSTLALQVISLPPSPSVAASARSDGVRGAFGLPARPRGRSGLKLSRVTLLLPLPGTASQITASKCRHGSLASTAV